MSLLSHITKKGQIAVAVFVAWFFFSPLTATSFNHFPGRHMPALVPPRNDFIFTIAALAIIAGLTHALFYLFTPSRISHAVFPAIGVGIFSAICATLVFLARSKLHLGWVPSATLIYFGTLLLSVGILFSYFVVTFIIRKQDVSL